MAKKKREQTSQERKTETDQLRLGDYLSGEVLQQLKEKEKELQRSEQQKQEEEKQRRTEERKQREKNKSFEELLNESEFNWKAFK